MYITLFVTVWTAPLYDNYFLIQFITIENGDILYPPQYYSDVAPTAWPPFDEPYAKQLTNSWYHAADSYQPQGWNGQYHPSPDFYGNPLKNPYQRAPGQLWVPPEQNRQIYPVMS